MACSGSRKILVLFELNASEQVTSLDFAKAIASVGSLVKNYFPASSINFSPWRDDPYTNKWLEDETLDLAFHFPGWNPNLQCRSFLIQLRVVKDDSRELPRLLGVIIRGVTFNGESWRLVTIGDWKFTGPHLPHKLVMQNLQDLCHDLFLLFASD